MTQEQKLLILESKLALLLDYRKRCPKRKIVIVNRKVERIENRINLYYARLSQIA
jgi:hypothetical protein